MGQMGLVSTKPNSRKQQWKHRRRYGCGRVVALEHHIFRAGEWRRAKLTSHPTVRINVSVSQNMTCAPSHRVEVMAVADSGAQSNLWSLKEFDAAGFPRSALSRVVLNLKAANSSAIPIEGAFFANIDGLSDDGQPFRAAP